MYEDWYLLDDYASLGVLNEAAVGRGHRTATTTSRTLAGPGAGGVYALLEGEPERLVGRRRSRCGSRPAPAAGARESAALGPAELLGDGMDRRQRQPLAAPARARSRARVLPAGARVAAGRAREPAAAGMRARRELAR